MKIKIPIIGTTVTTAINEGNPVSYADSENGFGVSRISWIRGLEDCDSTDIPAPAAGLISSVPLAAKVPFGKVIAKREKP